MIEKLNNLKTELEGDVLFSHIDKMLYSTDASVYQQLPLGVAKPANKQDCKLIVEWANENKIPLIPRAAGTSLAGQVVGSGLVVDISRYMNANDELNVENHSISVEPGVIQDDLNAIVAKNNLQFGPDTSTSNRCMIGGMIGNNACGEHSIIYKTTREHCLSLDVILSDGSEVTFKALTLDELENKQKQNDLEGKIYKGLVSLINENKKHIEDIFPKKNIVRRNMGYALDYLANCQPWNPQGERFNLAPFMCGSEGTLCLITKATMNLVSKPKEKILLCAHFNSVMDACKATIIAVKYNPSAVELVDGIILGATEGNLEQQRNRFWIEGKPEAALAIEFYGDDETELKQNADKLIEELQKNDLGYAFPFIPKDKQARIWALRKAGLGLLMGIPGDVKSLPIIEDAAVDVNDLPAYVEKIQEFMKRIDVSCVFYAHVSVGLLHLRPGLDLKKEEDVKKFIQIGEEVSSLVKSFGGSFSGEHGDGRLRAPYLKKMFDEKIYNLFKDVKNLFDPNNIFNPNKIVDAFPMTQDLRFTAPHTTPEVETFLNWSSDFGLIRAIEKCNGAGVCRKSSGIGTMCPSYQATKDELHSTRGRSNIFRQIMESEGAEKAFTNKEISDALDLCLSCKACKSECPANVDMARLKAEFLQQKHAREGTPIRSKLFAYFALQGMLLSLFPHWLQKLSANPIVKKIVGIHPKRSIPLFSRLSFAKWWNKHDKKLDGQPVVLFLDEFTRYINPEVACDAVEVLEKLGCTITPIWGIDSARSFISKGLLKVAQKRLNKSVEKLAEYAEKDYLIVGLEPSALLSFRDEAPDLVSANLADKAKLINDKSLLFEELLVKLHNEGKMKNITLTAPGKKVLVHEHCQAKSLCGTGITVESLQCIPNWEVDLIPSGCCGMAGSFGYEKEHYDISMQIANESLLPAIREADEDTIICAPGISCRHQILDGANTKSYHTAQLFKQAIL